MSDLMANSDSSQETIRSAGLNSLFAPTADKASDNSADIFTDSTDDIDPNPTEDKTMVMGSVDAGDVSVEEGPSVVEWAESIADESESTASMKPVNETESTATMKEVEDAESTASMKSVNDAESTSSMAPVSEHDFKNLSKETVVASKNELSGFDFAEPEKEPEVIVSERTSTDDEFLDHDQAKDSYSFDKYGDIGQRSSERNLFNMNAGRSGRIYAGNSDAGKSGRIYAGNTDVGKSGRIKVTANVKDIDQQNEILSGSKETTGRITGRIKVDAYNNTESQATNDSIDSKESTKQDDPKPKRAFFGRDARRDISDVLSDIESKRNKNSADGSGRNNVNLSNQYKASSSDTDAPTRLVPENANRKLVVLKPVDNNCVSQIAKELTAGNALVLCLKRTPAQHCNRILDFAFGAASMCGAQVSLDSEKTYVFTIGSGLTTKEVAQAIQQGVLVKG